MILELKKVNKHFGKLKALNDVSFEVEKEEIFGLAGPNGSGKTTLFNVITGMLPGSGDIIFDGESINGLRPHQICHHRIARTFQIPLVFSTLSVFDNVRVGAHFGVDGQQDEGKNINEVLSFVGLKEKENVTAGNLRLFDRKLTMLAAALVTKPKLLLIDEPLGGLTPTEIRLLVELINKIRRECGVTIIVIEHLMRELMGLCQRLMILNYGEIVCIGPPDEVAKDNRVIEIYLGAEYARSK